MSLGFEIGTWVAIRRADYCRGRMSAERRLASPSLDKLSTGAASVFWTDM